jgi:hypothetical protein
MEFIAGTIVGAFVVWAIMRPAARAHLSPRGQNGLPKTDGWKATYIRRR